MNRRQSVSKLATGFFASLGVAFFSTCKLIADHFSAYSWPNYPGEATLRKHLLGKPHYYKQHELDKLTFTEIRELHDQHHSDLGGKPPSASRLWMNRSYKKPSIPEQPPADSPDNVPITDVEIQPPY